MGHRRPGPGAVGRTEARQGEHAAERPATARRGPQHPWGDSDPATLPVPATPTSALGLALVPVPALATRRGPFEGEPCGCPPPELEPNRDRPFGAASPALSMAGAVARVSFWGVARK